jgi:hypothetical protein
VAAAAVADLLYRPARPVLAEEAVEAAAALRPNLLLRLIVSLKPRVFSPAPLLAARKAKSLL